MPISQFRCVLHGSFRKHFEEIMRVHRLFMEQGIEVLAPTVSEVKQEDDGFVMLESDQGQDQRMIELLYLQNLKRLGEGGFSYFVNPEGYIGKSTSYELGIAQVSNVRCFFQEKPKDHPAYVHRNAIWTPERLAVFIVERGALPEPQIHKDEQAIHHLWESLMVPGSVVAVGGIIEYQSRTSCAEKEVLLVKTHKWGGRYSMVGGKVRRHERLEDALRREVKEETGLDGAIGAHICTFDQIKQSGYYRAGIQHLFIDKIVTVDRKRVTLNDEAEEFLWIPPRIALQELPIEPNARHTLEQYMLSYGP